MSPPAATKEEGKKRKSSSGSISADAGNTGTAAVKISKVNMHHELTKLEEQEAKNRSPDDDSEIFAQTITEVKKHLKEVMNLKIKKGDAKASADISEHRIQACLRLLTLKKLNRIDKLRTRTCREATNGAKQKVDALHLQLQNLLYEVLHLQKEITKCQQFKSKDEEIDLIPVAEFYHKAPEDTSKPEVTQHNFHLQRLARLEFENQQRSEMNNAYKKFETSQEMIEKIIREKKEKLSSLKPQLQTILEKSLPVQEYLSLPLTEERDQLKLARYLPKPLFILFSETRAFGQACDKNLLVKIKGDLEEARLFHSRGHEGDKDEDEENDIAEDNLEDEETGKKKRGGKGVAASKQMSKQEERLQKLLSLHPLTVEVQIRVPESDTSVHMTFNYLTKVKVVAVKVELGLGKELKGFSPDQEVLQAGNLLSHLFKPDCGLRSPNPTTKYFLNEIGMSSIPPSQMENLGFFYDWVQRLAGMDFPNLEEESHDDSIFEDRVKVDAEICQTKVQDIILGIRTRVVARLSLQRQISQLEKAKVLSVELSVPAELAGEFPTGGSSSRIRNWTSVNWEDYTQVDITRHLVTGHLVDGNDFFYRLQINRDPASLIALIAIKPDYPVRAPIFCLNLHWGREFNLANSENIRALETLVNTSFQDLPSGLRPEILSLQLQRLLTSLDVLLESWNTLEETGTKVDFKKEKMFLRATRGRNRALPLIYNSKMKLFSHH